MVLVGYSDSEGSSDEDVKLSTKTQSTRPSSTSKPAFQKVINRSKPHKILVSLPDPVNKDETDSLDAERPPTKKARVDGGGLGGFNALLPAPKKAATSIFKVITKTGGLGSGVSLKTGAAPGFSRDAAPQSEQRDQSQNDTSLHNDVSQKEKDSLSSNSNVKELAPTSEVKIKGNSMMFKPLSVARKPQKKKPAARSVDPSAGQEIAVAGQPVQTKASKVSLFSMHTSEAREAPNTHTAGDYQPMVYKNASNEPQEETSDDDPGNSSNAQGIAPPLSGTQYDKPQSLDAIAADLNLSASARRQLLGRTTAASNSSSAAINILNFNTDAEYASNEELRQAGEQQAHNPVRALAPGKHSLKQLVNAVQSQKDALEDQFASGKRNRKEAGNRYGW